MARGISKRTLDEVRFRCDIVDVIGSYINVKKAGSSFKALCPFHTEKTPSFNIHQQRQIFHCFGCGKGGDVFGFVMMQEGVDFIGAVKILADKAGIKLEIDDDAGDGLNKDLLFRILHETADLFCKTLHDDPKAEVARRYLKDRDLTGDVEKEFRIGYAPDSWDFLMGWASDNKYTIEQMELAGLIVKSVKEQGEAHYYDRFRGRVMFPITDEQARVIGFTGRTLEKNPEGAKYVNSPETPLFHKARILYALDKARKNIVEAREAVICEGQIDVIRCHQFGFKTAVASQGTAFSEDHSRILQRYADSVVLVFDPDTAGREAAIRTSSIFLQSGMAVRVASLPTGQDPDLFLRKNGKDAFAAMLKSASSIIAFQVADLARTENLKSEIGVMRASKALIATVAHSNNAVQRDAMMQEAARLIGLRPSALVDELRKYMRKQEGSERRSQEGEAAVADVVRPKEEVELCEHLSRGPDSVPVIQCVRKYLPLTMISDPYCRMMVDAVFSADKKASDLGDEVREMAEKDASFLAFATGIMMATNKAGGREFSAEDAAKGLILYIWRREMEKRRAGVKIAGQDSSEGAEQRAQITYHLQALRRWETAIPIMELEMTASQ